MTKASTLCALAAFLLPPGVACAADAPWLWQIGVEDRDAREFALAPGGDERFQADAVFLVGASGR